MRSLHRMMSALVIAATVSTGYPRIARCEDKAAALDLFNAAKKDMDAKNYVEACRKLEVARKHDPSLDGVVLNLAKCYEEQGKWASAWGMYRDSLVRAQKANRPERVELAKKGIAATEPKISRVTVKVAAPTPGLEVRRDDNTLDAGELGIPLPIDPGEHTLTATAPGKTTWTTKFTIAPTAESRTIDVPALESVPLPPSPSPSASSSPTIPTRDTPLRPPSSPVGGYVALGVGGVLLAGGVGAHFIARSSYDDYKAGCAEQTSPTCEDSAGRSKVQTWQTVSLVAGSAGLVALGIGVVLLVSHKSNGTSPATASIVAAPSIGTSSAGLSLSGSF